MLGRCFAKSRERSNATDVVARPVDDQRRHAHVGKRRRIDARRVAREIEVDARATAVHEVIDLEPAALFCRAPLRFAGARAPLRDELERGREEHERANTRIALGESRGGEPAEARAQDHRTIVRAADRGARGLDHRREPKMLERRHAQIQSLDRDPTRGEVRGDRDALLRVGAGGEAVEVEELGHVDSAVGWGRCIGAE